MLSLLIRTVSSLALMTLVLPSAQSAEKLSRVELAKRAKAATVLVQIQQTSSRRDFDPTNRFNRGGGGFGRGAGGRDRGGRRGFSRISMGSAFCVDPSGLFLTSASILPQGDSSQIQLILRPDQKTVTTVDAKVVSLSKEQDFALLWAPEVADFPTLPVASFVKPEKPLEVITCGFPASTRSSRTYPNVQMTLEELSSINQPERPDPGLQLKAPNEALGGAVMNFSGEVVGMVRSGQENQAGLVIPGKDLIAFLKQPVWLFKVPTLSKVNRNQPLEFEARLFALGSNVNPPKVVELLLKTSEEVKVRRLQMTGKGNIYTIKTIPVPQSKEAPLLTVSISFEDGTIVGSIRDQQIKLLDDTYQLSSISGFRQQDGKAEITFQDEKQITVPNVLLPIVGVQVADQVWKLDLGKAFRMSIYPAREVSGVTAALHTFQDGKDVKLTQQSVPITWTVSTRPSLPDPRGRTSVDAAALRSAQILFDRFDTNRDRRLDVQDGADAVRVLQMLGKTERDVVNLREFAELYGNRSRRSSSSRGSSAPSRGSSTPPGRGFPR